MRVTLSIPDDLAAQIEARDNGKPTRGRPGFPGHVLRRDLKRYYDLLQLELRRLDLTEGEACLIADDNNGLFAHPSEPPVNRLELVAKLCAMTPAQTLALTDAIERLWADPQTTVQSVGLAQTLRS